MIDIENILDMGVAEDIKEIDSGKGLIADIKLWSDKFLNFVNSLNSSKHTLRAYTFTKKSLIEFVKDKRNFTEDCSSLSEFNLHLVNNYLVYLENYNINRDYGGIEYRIMILFKFKDEVLKCKSINSFLQLPKVLQNKLTINEIETFEYMVNDFARFMQKNNTVPNKLKNEHIKNYIASIKKASNKTMQLRKAALQSFFSYIDKSTKQNHFKDMYWEMKKYPLPKETNKVIKSAFDEKLLDKLLNILSDYPKHLKKYIKDESKIYKNSKYTAYKNTLMILIMLHGGARAAEVVNIKFSDISLIEVKSGAKMYQFAVVGKGNKNRHIYVKKEHIVNHLEHIYTNRGDNVHLSSKKNNSKPLTTQALFLFAEKMFKMIDSNKKGLHIFRHHFASNFAENNGNIKLLQDLLGHSNITTTMIYSDVRDKAKAEALSEF